MRKIAYQTDCNQNSLFFSEDHNDILGRKYYIDPGNLFSISYSMLKHQYLA